MQIKITAFVVFLCLIFWGNSVDAAHLVGGHITYTCQGNGVYEIKLRIYRDCGSGGANFDNNAIITIYNSQGVVVQNLTVPKGPTISVNPNPGNDPCLVVPSGLCTEYAEYVTTATLPPLTGGYTISHQRCCRNSSISNITNPGSRGNTYTINIPSLDSCNNSPQVNGVAPTILCIGEALNLPINVSEADGDSLFYELCDLFTGGGQSGGTGCNAVIPNPACPPPYTTIPFVAPYSAQYPLSSAPAFGIDSQTGVLFGTPNLVGQFVVGMCISEFRNGQLLSTVRFDYQFNVNNCGSPIAGFVTPQDDPSILCDGLTVKFISQASNATAVLWDFGVPGISTDTSSNPITTYTYPAQGNYVVSLIAFQGASCADTFQFQFNVQKEVEVEISYTGINCFEVQGFEFEPIGFWSASTTFNWQFSPGANLAQFSGQKTPPVSWNTPGQHVVMLILAWGAGCSDTLYDTIGVSSLSVSVSAGPDQTLLSGQVAQLMANGGTQYFWYSNVPAYFSNQFSQNPTSLPLADTTTYYVEVTDEFGCKGIDSMRVFLTYPPKEEIMNVITPNNDGRNDVLNLSNVTLNDPCRFVVMNRWGRQVYIQEPYNNKWSGVNSGGQPLPDGTYYFILQFGDEIRYQGAVTIIMGE